MSKRFQLTPEQIALSEERKAKKQKLQNQAPPPNVEEIKGSILPRPWMDLERTDHLDDIRVKIMTWNLLAQCLVRKWCFTRTVLPKNVWLGRELFPTSGNILKGIQRQPTLHAEILAQNADIMCLQVNLSLVHIKLLYQCSLSRKWIVSINSCPLWRRQVITITMLLARAKSMDVSLRLRKPTAS